MLSPRETISAAEERFENFRRKSGFYLAPAGFFLTLWWASSFLPVPAARLSAVLVLMVIFWLTESIPLPVTALLGAVLNIILGVGEAKAVLAPWSSQANPLLALADYITSRDR